MKTLNLAGLAALMAVAAPFSVSASGIDELLAASEGAEFSFSAVPVAFQAETREAEQYLPPDNDEPGFDWPRRATKGADGDYFFTGKADTFLKASASQAADLANGAGKCALKPGTLYRTSGTPGFEGEHMTVNLAEPLSGCQFTSGYVYMTHVASSSAGGLWELPKTVRAFMDTLAFSEGTNDRYNYIFTYVVFTSYVDHPRKIACEGKLCSSAAGRYQFLSKTWDALAADLGLRDFTPPSQEKAGVELIRRAGAYKLALKSDKYANFAAAVNKTNRIWASLPGSPYGQPTHSMAKLWKAYQEALAKY